MVTSNELAIIRTKLANQRTYLAYLRTGIGIASIAAAFKKLYIVFFGLFMVGLSAYQYIYINNNMNNQQNFNNVYLDNIPLIYVLLAFITYYLQYNR
jgi:uncharacterized membrane protein YidH (DUF202 family)